MNMSDWHDMISKTNLCKACLFQHFRLTITVQHAGTIMQTMLVFRQISCLPYLQFLYLPKLNAFLLW